MAKQMEIACGTGYQRLECWEYYKSQCQHRCHKAYKASMVCAFLLCKGSKIFTNKWHGCQDKQKMKMIER